jgi:hypothetical protein
MVKGLLVIVHAWIVSCTLTLSVMECASLMAHVEQVTFTSARVGVRLLPIDNLTEMMIAALCQPQHKGYLLQRMLCCGCLCTAAVVTDSTMA